MQADERQTSSLRRTVNDIVLAEMFLLQATIESATAIGDGLSQLGQQLSNSDEDRTSPWDAISTILRNTADDAVEPYTTRFRYLRDINR